MPDSQSTPPATPQQALPLDLLILTALAGALVIAVAGAFAPVEWIQYYASRLWMPVWVMAVLLYGGPRVAGRRAWVTKAFRFGRGQFVEWGGGPYAAIAIVCFGWLEWAQLRELVQWIAETEWYTDKFGVREIVRGAFRNVLDFFIGSFMNGLHAFVWPAFWKRCFTVGQQWPAVAVAWTLFEAGKWAARKLPGRTEANPPA
jgi:hypothetical protein